MRAIKFRAWNAQTKQMEGPVAFFAPHEAIPTHWSLLQVMQFTGLTDKNGKEIYEGDIVENKAWEPNRFQVGFDRGGFCFFNTGDVYYNDAKYLTEFEVIGDIYQTPELLNLITV